jgi:hypothetical protein
LVFLHVRNQRQRLEKKIVHNIIMTSLFTNRISRVCVLWLSCFVLLLSALRVTAADGPSSTNSLLRIDPDYSDVVVPPNLAPLNFDILGTSEECAVKISSKEGTPIETRSKNHHVSIPLASWRQLLQSNRGNELLFHIAPANPHGNSNLCLNITNSIAHEDIDGWMVYRKLNWQLSKFGNGTIGIYQRNLQTFEETEILRINQRGSHGSTCMNCHTFLKNRPDTMALNIRVEKNPLLIAKNGEVTTVNKTAGLLAWHPNGDLLAFSENKFVMIYHTVGNINDIYDGAGDLFVYSCKANRVTTTPSISRPDQWETWPTWSPDGRYLYFCRAPKASEEEFKRVRYSLMRIPYDEKTEKWGELETVLSSTTTGLSITQPRISPDGRYLMFTMAPYGGFMVTHPQSDLYLMDLTTRQYQRLDVVNSDRTDSWHCWSSSGRWFVFSSKRRDGLLLRPYLGYFDANGHAHKPLLVPQKDMSFYNASPKIINVPELITGPVKVTERQLFDAIYKPSHTVKPQMQIPERAPAPASEKTGYDVQPQ